MVVYDNLNFCCQSLFSLVVRHYTAISSRMISIVKVPDVIDPFLDGEVHSCVIVSRAVTFMRHVIVSRHEDELSTAIEASSSSCCVWWRLQPWHPQTSSVWCCEPQKCIVWSRLMRRPKLLLSVAWTKRNTLCSRCECVLCETTCKNSWSRLQLNCAWQFYHSKCSLSLDRQTLGIHCYNKAGIAVIAFRTEVKLLGTCLPLQAGFTEMWR